MIFDSPAGSSKFGHHGSELGTSTYSFPDAEKIRRKLLDDRHEISNLVGSEFLL
jgi:hypothetical protein